MLSNMMPLRLASTLSADCPNNTALEKLLASLPEVHRRDAEYVRQRIHVDGPGSSYNKTDVQYLPTLQKAVWEERKLVLTYHLSTGPVVDYVLEPLGLVARGQTWYLVAFFKGDVSVYRVSRIKQATSLDETSVRLDGFDLTALIRSSIAVLILTCRCKFGLRSSKRPCSFFMAKSASI